MDDLLAPIFTRVRKLMKDFIGRIGGTAVAMSRAAFSEASKELRKIEDTLRAALSLMAVDVVLPPPLPKRHAKPRAERATPKPATPQSTPRIGVFNPCVPLDTPIAAPKCAPSVGTRRTDTPTAEPTTESLLRRIARMQAVLDNPLPYAERVARYMDENAPNITLGDVGHYLPPDLADSPNAPRGLLAIQPKWPPG